MRLTNRQILAKGRDKYIMDEIDQARRCVARGTDAHGRQIKYPDAYLQKTMSNAKERWRRASKHSN